MDLFVRVRTPHGATRAGILEGDRVVAIREPFWERVERAGEQFALAEVQLLAPCAPRSVVCVGLNYASHLQGRPIPDPPTLFFKPLSSLIGPGETIRLPADAGRIDPEGEIVVVIGSTLKNATREEAIAAVFGYTAGNDVSARAWQRGDGQWWRAKGSDTFGAFGPAIATGLAHDAIDLETRVNGTRVQHARSDELIRDIPEIVRYVSAAMTLVPGDIIYTGTPGEPQPLSPGDTVEVEISGAGVLRNPVE